MKNLTHEEIMLLNKYIPHSMIIFNNQEVLFSNCLFKDSCIDESSLKQYADTYSINENFNTEFNVISVHGEKKCFQMSGEPVWVDEKLFCLSFLIDITEKKAQEEKLIKMCTMRDRMLDINNSIITMNDLNEVMRMILKNALKAIDKASLGSIFIIDDEDFRLISQVGFGKDIDKFQLPVRDAFIYTATEGKMDRIVRCGNFQSMDTIHPIRTQDGELIQSTISAPIYTNKALMGIINIDSVQRDAFDDDDLKSMEFVRNNIEIAISNHLSYAEKANLAEYDCLTKAYNRNFICEQFKMLKEKAIALNEKFYVVMIDIDRLKSTNDNYGHLTGDKVIVRIASELFKISRKNDVIIRFGGDEFIGIFFNTDKEGLKHKLDNINKKLKSNPVYIQGTKISPSFTYGIACFPDNGMELDELIKVADEKMYRKKVR